MSAIAASLNSTNVRNTVGLAWQRMNLAVAAVVAPERAVETAARLFATPPRFDRPAHEHEALALGVRFDVETAMGKIAAWRFGERHRPAAILIHGWAGRGAQLRAFAPALRDAGYQAVMFDAPAHGESEGRESSIVHFMRGLEAVVAAVEADGAKVVGLVGHSLGAAAATAWLNETRRKMRVVLVAPPISVQRYSAWFARKFGIPESVRRRMQERFERRYGYRWADFELPKSVAHVKADALVIHDAEDRDVVPASGLALARAWPRAAWIATRGLGHRRILRDPSVVADAVDFIGDRVRFSSPPRRGEASAFFQPAPLV